MSDRNIIGWGTEIVIPIIGGISESHPINKILSALAKIDKLIINSFVSVGHFNALAIHFTCIPGNDIDHALSGIRTV